MKRLCFAVMLCLALSCNEDRPSHARGKTKAADIQHDAEKTLDTTGRYVTEQRDDFARRMQERIDQADADIRRLRRSLDEQGKNAQAGADQQLRTLEDRKAIAERQLGELKRSSSASWKDFRDGVEKAVNDLSPSDRK